MSSDNNNIKSLKTLCCEAILNDPLPFMTSTDINVVAADSTLMRPIPMEAFMHSLLQTVEHLWKDRVNDPNGQIDKGDIGLIQQAIQDNYKRTNHMTIVKMTARRLVEAATCQCCGTELIGIQHNCGD